MEGNLKEVIKEVKRKLKVDIGTIITDVPERLRVYLV